MNPFNLLYYVSMWLSVKHLQNHALDEQFGQVNFSFSLVIENHLEMVCSNGNAIRALDPPKTEGRTVDSVQAW